MRFAFFDLDKTLIARNSATLWIKSELRDGHISRRTALRGLGWIVKYHFGAAEMDYALRNAVGLMTGLMERDLIERTARFFQRDIRSLYRRGALEAVERHRNAGDRLVLLTSSSSYLSELVCRDLRLHDYLSNRFEVDHDGRYTGLPVEPLCFGPGKVTLAQAYLQARGATFEHCTFYSDSLSDLPMLEAAGERVVVNPDPRLRREAKRRGWPVVDWGAPPPPAQAVALGPRG